jgi:hypothetical protein
MLRWFLQNAGIVRLAIILVLVLGPPAYIYKVRAAETEARKSAAASQLYRRAVVSSQGSAAERERVMPLALASLSRFETLEAQDVLHEALRSRLRVNSHDDGEEAAYSRFSLDGSCYASVQQPTVVRDPGKPYFLRIFKLSPKKEVLGLYVVDDFKRIVFSDACRTIVGVPRTLGGPNRIDVWTIAPQTAISVPLEPDERPLDVSRDGRFVLTANATLVRIHSVSQLIQPIPLKSGYNVVDARFSPEGNSVLLLGDDPKKGSILSSWTGWQNGSPTSATLAKVPQARGLWISPRSKWVAFLIMDGRVSVQNIATGRIAHPGTTSYRAFAPEEDRFAFQDGESLYMYDLGKGDQTLVAHGTPRDVAIHPTMSRVVATLGEDGEIRVFSENTEIVRMAGIANIDQIGFSADGRRLMALSNSGESIAFNLENNENQNGTILGSSTATVFTDNQTLKSLSIFGDLETINLETRRRNRSPFGNPWNAVFVPNGKFAVTVNGNGGSRPNGPVTIHDLSKGTVTLVGEKSHSYFQLRVAPEGGSLAFLRLKGRRALPDSLPTLQFDAPATRDPSEAVIVQLPDGDTLNEIPLGNGGVVDLAVSMTAQTLSIITGHDPAIFRWNVLTGHSIPPLMTGSNAVKLAYNARGVLAASLGSEIVVFEPNGSLRWRRSISHVPITAMDWSSDGELLSCASYEISTP